MPVAILMPAFDEPGRLARTLGSIQERSASLGGVHVFLVDDGSEPPIDVDALPSPSPNFRLTVARHVVNLGQGAALETARQLALLPPAEGRADLQAARCARPDFDAFVTMDADGQHRIEDLAALVAAVTAGADVALGNRFAGESNVPSARRRLLHAARLFERVVTGLSLADAHNGYRAFSRRALEQVPILENRMAHATEITRRISQAGLVIAEVPVSVRYSPETLAKGQSSAGAVAIVRDLVYRYLFEERSGHGTR